ncbi:MAG: HAMP domain-containing protein, partial [Calditrichia bacterium]
FHGISDSLLSRLDDQLKGLEDLKILEHKFLPDSAPAIRKKIRSAIDKAWEESKLKDKVADAVRQDLIWRTVRKNQHRVAELLKSEKKREFDMSKSQAKTDLLEAEQTARDSVLFQTIDINLNALGDRDSASVFRVVTHPQAPGSNGHTFTFRVPDFSVPQVPRILQYSYNTAAMKKTLIDIRNRNLLITLAIFLLSMGAILLISRRFVQPIGQLKNSFERVVNGNLDIRVPDQTRDEIGDLTRSFNRNTASG